MGWEREYEHWRDKGYTWGPGIDIRREPTEKEIMEAEARRKAYEEELASIRVGAREKWIQKGKELENSIPELKKLAEEGYPYDWRQRYSVKKIQLCKEATQEMGYPFGLRDGNEDKNKFLIKVSYYGYLPEKIGNIHSFVASGITSPKDCLQLVADFGAIGCNTTTFYKNHYISMDDTARLRKKMEKWGVDFEEDIIPELEYLAPGTRVFISGYSDELWISDYHVRVSTEGTVMEVPKKDSRKVLVTLDEIDGDRNVCVSVRRTKVRAIEKDRTLDIDKMIQDGITLHEVSEELDYRERNSISEGKDGWNDNFIGYSTKELEALEKEWTEREEKVPAGLDEKISGATKMCSGRKDFSVPVKESEHGTR